jgi:hypothetical protein
VVEKVMTDIINLGLFTTSEGRIFCIKLLKRINLSMTSNTTFRDAISKKKAEYHDTVMTRHDTIMLPTIPTIPTIPTKKKEPEPLPAEAGSLATLLYTLHIQNISKARDVTDSQFRKWSEDIDKINRIDGRSWEEIEKVIRHVKTSGNFWAPNIMSGAKLRDKFDTIFAQMQSKPRTQTGIQTEAEREAQFARIAKELERERTVYG